MIQMKKEGGGGRETHRFPPPLPLLLPPSKCTVALLAFGSQTTDEEEDEGRKGGEGLALNNVRKGGRRRLCTYVRCMGTAHTQREKRGVRTLPLTHTGRRERKAERRR